MVETKKWSALGWPVQTKHTSIRVNIIWETPIMWQLSSKIPVVNSYFLKILVLISTLLSRICRSSCCYSRNTNISSGLELSSILLLKIRPFYIVSLNIEWQGRLVSWLAPHFTSLCPEYKTWCILPGIKIIGKMTTTNPHLGKKIFWMIS